MSGITVICPNSHRCRVKVTPATQLRKVLEEACLKQGFDVSEYELRHGGRALDLSLSFRLSGLPNNVTVEMAPSEFKNTGAQVQIALQLANGERLTSDFCSRATLLDILETFSKVSKQDFIHCSDNQVPSCAYMSKEYRGEKELSTITLESIGVMSGRCLIRYSAVTMTPEEMQRLESRLTEEGMRKKKMQEGFEERKAELERRAQIAAEREKEFERQLKEKRPADAEASFHATVEQSATSHESTRNTTATTVLPPTEDLRLPQNTATSPQSNLSRLQYLQSLLNQVNLSLGSNNATAQSNEASASYAPGISQFGQHVLQSSSVQVGMHEQTSSTPNICETAKPADIISERAERCDRAAVFIKERGDVPDEVADIDDDFYELTVNDVQSIRRDLQAEASANEQRQLLPKKYLVEKNRQLKASCYKHTVVRFMIDDKNILQAQFNSLEPVSRLFEFIVENLFNPDAKFTLNFALNRKLDPNDTKSLLDSGISPKTTLFLKFTNKIDDIGSLFSLASIKVVTSKEADQRSSHWLSVNELYRPYDPKVPNTNDLRPKPKRQSDTEHDAGPSKCKQTSNTGVPKWFQKR